MRVARESLESVDPDRNTIFLTQTNDLRKPASLGSSPRDTLLRDLKINALFQERLLIRDIDIINSAPLQEIIRDNAARFHSALEARVFLLGLRSEAPSFTELNRVQGERRAFPHLCELSESFCAEFDRFLVKHQICGVELNLRSRSPTVGY